MGGARVLGIHTTFREVLSSELKGQFQKVLKSCHSRPAPALPRPTSFRFVFFFSSPPHKSWEWKTSVQQGLWNLCEFVVNCQFPETTATKNVCGFEMAGRLCAVRPNWRG